MQTSRSDTGDDVGIMQDYMSYISGWMLINAVAVNPKKNVFVSASS